MKERSFLLVKPESVQMGLRDEAIELLAKEGLHFEKTADLQFESEDVATIYAKRMEGEHAERMVSYMTQGPSHVIYVTGESAIEKVQKVKGKTWSEKGLRGKYAKDFIENNFHSPDSQEEYDLNVEIMSKREIVVFDSSKDS